ncbi:MAG: tryptophan synthase subunit alpha [Pseudobdellovibrionaceae bacterium]
MHSTSSISKISDLFVTKSSKRFIAYLTAGDPSLAVTGKFVLSLQKSGVDLIEVGLPYTDPIADGPTNIQAAERALRNPIDLEQILVAIGGWREQGLKIPVLIFTYWNLILQFGVEKFAQKAQACGVQGVLFVDLPPEEADGVLPILEKHQQQTVFLCSPTTSEERLKKINQSSTGFVYYVSRAGVTGARTELVNTLAEDLQRIRKHITKPIAVGFGISTPQQAQQVASLAEGVIVGSALVSLIEKWGHEPDKACAEIEKWTTQMVQAVKG